jgi:hypothetical protein
MDIQSKIDSKVDFATLDTLEKDLQEQIDGLRRSVRTTFIGQGILIVMLIILVVLQAI